MIFDHAISLK